MPGKLTAFDTDIHVPLVVVGPGVPAGKTPDAMTENIDLAETFAAIAGTTHRRRRSQPRPLSTDSRTRHWRNAILVEHHGPDLRRSIRTSSSRPAEARARYEAMRTRQFLYVEYPDGEREFYDLRTDPFELHNVAGQLTARPLARSTASSPPRAVPRRATVLGGDARRAAAPRLKPGAGELGEFISPRETATHASHRGQGGSMDIRSRPCRRARRPGRPR